MSYNMSKDQIRLKVFNRTLKRKYEQNPEKYEVLKELLTLSDEEKKAILDAAVLPNSIEINNIKYSMFFGYLFSDKKRTKSLNNFFSFVINTISTLTKTEKELIKFGYINGFDSKDPLSNYQFFIKHSIFGEEIEKPKFMTLYAFKKIFSFVYKLIKKGELNEQFPSTR